jgi:hypothetical protein
MSTNTANQPEQTAAEFLATQLRTAYNLPVLAVHEATHTTDAEVEITRHISVQVSDTRWGRETYEVCAYDRDEDGDVTAVAYVSSRTLTTVRDVALRVRAALQNPEYNHAA